MEITLLSTEAIKLRGKHASITINPNGSKGKQSSDVVLFFNRFSDKITFVESYKVIIDGPGEYEAGGIKISCYKIGEDNLFSIDLDGLEILISKSNTLSKAKEILTEYDLVILNSQTIADQSIVTSLNAKTVVLYGEKKEENAKAIGAAKTNTVNKYVVSKEKLPSDTEVVVLG